MTRNWLGEDQGEAEENTTVKTKLNTSEKPRGQCSCRAVGKKSGYKTMLEKEADLSQGKYFGLFPKCDGKPFNAVLCVFWNDHLAAIWRVE